MVLCWIFRSTCLSESEKGMEIDQIKSNFKRYKPEEIFKAIMPFLIPCSACIKGLCVATLKRYGNALVYKCLECGEAVTSGNNGRLIDAYAELRKKNGQDDCYIPDCDRPGEAEAEMPVKLCWKHLGYEKKK